jgi:hypothetical protein
MVAALLANVVGVSKRKGFPDASKRIPCSCLIIVVASSPLGGKSSLPSVNRAFPIVVVKLASNARKSLSLNNTKLFGETAESLISKVALPEVT